MPFNNDYSYSCANLSTVVNMSFAVHLDFDGITDFLMEFQTRIAFLCNLILVESLQLEFLLPDDADVSQHKVLTVVCNSSNENMRSVRGTIISHNILD